ncbi:hypothetical protein [Natrinema salsiterrestre]|uniref:Uncharacterized protein n=1 Tax=Natrinema salsiterrestre TaxID=2950540 RepID=A0A9Q4KZ21_9EURY|nr:hypothetical protein [Natrinema salsiterrestre]MDF9744771.1 hypothetical protein [Natrinema salsiterrestre]
MADPRSRNHSRFLLVVLLAVVVLGAWATRFLETPVNRVTVGTVVAGALLVVGALALPALILSTWQSERE